MIINKICRKFKRTYLSSKRIKLAYPSCFPMLWLTFCLPRLHISSQFMAVMFYPRESYGSCALTSKRVIFNLKNFYVCHSILVITSLFPKRVILIPKKISIAWISISLWQSCSPLENLSQSFLILYGSCTFLK